MVYLNIEANDIKSSVVVKSNAIMPQIRLINHPTETLALRLICIGPLIKHHRYEP